MTSVLRLTFLMMSVGIAMATTGARADDAVDLTAAEAQFMKSCGTCHTVEPGAPVRQGPNLHTAFGRTAGMDADFPAYSDALKKAGAGGLVWTEENIDKWISGAADFIPGTNMAYSQPDAAKRALVIAYLKSLAPGGDDKKE